jgi:nucleotide-binding universal stress UspA family protein
MGEFTNERLVDFLLGLDRDPELEEALRREPRLRRRCHALELDLRSLDGELAAVLKGGAREPLAGTCWQILLCVEDTPASWRATRAAAALARRTDAAVEVLHVRDMGVGRCAGRLPPETMREATAVLSRAFGELRDCGVAAWGQLERAPVGHVADQIVAEARDIEADVIVLGSSTHSWPLFLGGTRVGAAVLKKAGCPVLVAA